ncbi:MAG: hypothetical protein HGA85_05025 [Nanoarchaeota archaeon]|nr:hypothetical protein [Nanoarchaeota archaeon]
MSDLIELIAMTKNAELSRQVASTYDSVNALTPPDENKIAWEIHKDRLLKFKREYEGETHPIFIAGLYWPDLIQRKKDSMNPELVDICVNYVRAHDLSIDSLRQSAAPFMRELSSALDIGERITDLQAEADSRIRTMLHEDNPSLRSDVFRCYENAIETRHRTYTETSAKSIKLGFYKAAIIESALKIDPLSLARNLAEYAVEAKGFNDAEGIACAKSAMSAYKIIGKADRLYPWDTQMLKELTGAYADKLFELM